MLRIDPSVFTLDALHCQKTVAKIIEQGYGYLITVKQNQPTLYKAIAGMNETRRADAWSWRPRGRGHDARCRLKVWPAAPGKVAELPQRIKTGAPAVGIIPPGRCGPALAAD